MKTYIQDVQKEAVQAGAKENSKETAKRMFR
jgi:hypothetical protein